MRLVLPMADRIPVEYVAYIYLRCSVGLHVWSNNPCFLCFFFKLRCSVSAPRPSPVFSAYVWMYFRPHHWLLTIQLTSSCTGNLSTVHVQYVQKGEEEKKENTSTHTKSYTQRSPFLASLWLTDVPINNQSPGGTRRSKTNTDKDEAQRAAPVQESCMHSVINYW